MTEENEPPVQVPSAKCTWPDDQDCEFAAKDRRHHTPSAFIALLRAFLLNLQLSLQDQL